jgi:uncharacterized alkaline shock family protein YloU
MSTPSTERTATASSTATRDTVSSALATEQGKTAIADSVVQKIAGMATQEIAGVYKLGTGTARMVGSLRERIPGSSGPSMSQGVAVEVGERQAAIDLDIVAEYGVSIADLANAVRRNVINSVQRMTSLEVTEVNISVNDIHTPGDDDESREPSRVE